MGVATPLARITAVLLAACTSVPRPSAGTMQLAAWERLPPLPVAVRSPSVAAVDGRIYVIGGAMAYTHESTSAVQILDTRTLRWSRGPDAPFGSEFHTAAVVDGRIHILSGHTNPVGATTRHWSYDPETEAWERLAPIPIAVNAATTHVLDGRIHVFGGVVRQDLRNAVQVYDPRTDSWSSGGELPVATLSMASALVDGRVHLVGGQTPSYQTSDQHLLYDPATRSFDRLAPHPTPFEAGGGGVLGGLLCVFGGRLARPGRFNESFAATTCYGSLGWSAGPSMSVARAEVGYVTVDDAIYAIGGDLDGVAVDAVERLWMRRPIASAW